jgi:phage-related minor tail protein
VALTVGELTGLITLDASGVGDGMRDAERQMQRGGQQMGEDAQRAGQQAGQQLGDGVTQGMRNLRQDLATAGQQAGQGLGDGVTRGADGRLRNVRGQFVRAGRQAGEGLGDGVRRAAPDVGDAAGDAGDQGGESFMQRMRGRASAGVGELAGNIREGLAGKLALASVGAAAGAMLMQGMAEAMDQSRIVGRLGAQLGATGPELRRYGHIAGSLFADAVTEDFQGAADAIKAIASSGLIPPKATNEQIKSIAANAADLANIMEVDVGQAAQAAASMVRNGLAKDGREAFDILTKGSRGLGIAAEDVMETFTEYGPVFKSAGLSGQTAMGLIRQAIQGGWSKDTDKIADAFKELGIRATDMSTGSVTALKQLGLNAKQTANDVAAGGTRGERAMDLILKKLQKLGPDSAEARQIISALFGGPGEDLGAALFSLNLGKASKSMGDTAGAADAMGDALRDNAGTKVEAFKRGLQQGVVDFLGTQVIPAITRLKMVVRGAFGSMWANAGAGGQQGMDRILSFFGLLGPKLVEKIKTLAPQAIEGISGLGQSIGAWMVANPDKVFRIALISAAIIAGLVSLPILVGAALIASIGVILVNLGRGLVQGIPAQLNRFGGVIGRWFGGLWTRYISAPTSRAFANLIRYISGLPGRATRALGSLGSALAALASTSWQRFKDGARLKGDQFVSWVRGLPGRAARGMGSLGSLLYGKGQDIVRGLYNGVRSMGGWLRDSLMSFARSMVPGPIARALGISSPSRVMADQIGRWIPAGIAQGVEQHSGVLDKAMSSLVSTPTPSKAMASSVGAAVGGTGGGRSGTSVVTLRSDGSAYADFLVGELRKVISARGGNVQFVLGR